MYFPFIFDKNVNRILSQWIKMRNFKINYLCKRVFLFFSYWIKISDNFIKYQNTQYREYNIVNLVPCLRAHLTCKHARRSSQNHNITSRKSVRCTRKLLKIKSKLILIPFTFFFSLVQNVVDTIYKETLWIEFMIDFLVYKNN